MKVHEKISWNRKIKQELITINSNEISYLKGEDIPYEDGTEQIDAHHFYSFDLDFFGKNSLFQNLNRTATYIGNSKLSNLLLSLKTNSEIQTNQQAIAELSEKIVWRQQVFALAKLIKDKKENYHNLIAWASAQQKRIPKILNVVFYITPIIFIASFLVFLFTKESLYSDIALYTFLFNLALTALQVKKIKYEIIGSDRIHETVKKYGIIIEQFENENFKSEKLNLFQKKLSLTTGLASNQIKKLSSLFYGLESIQNVMAAFILDGTILYHLHILSKLLNWKEKYSKEIKNWLEIIGEFESLNSLANFTYNNPNFIFPNLNIDHQIEFKDLGHPLLNKEKRICNDVEFKEKNFIILTGSNMSGKSTFLRTLGINMVLAGIGAPICSSKANIHPLNVLVSMRQADSLNDGESYFFAEVKRLKRIMDKLESERCFVLLDEVLKGTNSDDKQTGTIEVIKKMLAKNAIGAIATHDLDVCQTTNDYPNNLINKCFEVEIIDNDLSFDYKLRDGVCKNKSATFLMEKLEVI